MRKRLSSLAACLLSGTALVATSQTALAKSMSNAEIQQRLEALEDQLKAMNAIKKQVEDLKEQLAATQQQAAAAEKKAAAADNTKIKWHISGSTVADFTASDGSGKNSTFGGGKFLPIFLATYEDWLTFEGHLELSATSDGETEVSLEYAQSDFMVNDWLTLVAGKFLSPIGQFQQAIHPPWINKLPDRPAGFVEEGGDEPLSALGIMARGGFPVGPMKATYALFLGNGPRMGETGPELEGFVNDNNSDKAFGGRVSLFVLPHLELGVSGMHSRVAGMDAQGGSVTLADYNLLGADFAFTQGPWDIRGEYIHSELGALATALDSSDPLPTNVGKTTWNNWYVQGAYRMSGLTDDPVLGKFEPVIRYGQYNVNGIDQFSEDEENRLSVGLDYWFAPSVVGKIAYENRDYAHKEAENVFRAQFAYGF